MEKEIIEEKKKGGIEMEERKKTPESLTLFQIADTLFLEENISVYELNIIKDESIIVRKLSGRKDFKEMFAEYAECQKYGDDLRKKAASAKIAVIFRDEIEDFLLRFSDGLMQKYDERVREYEEEIPVSERDFVIKNIVNFQEERDMKVDAASSEVKRISDKLFAFNKELELKSNELARLSQSEREQKKEEIDGLKENRKFLLEELKAANENRSRALRNKESRQSDVSEKLRLYFEFGKTADTALDELIRKLDIGEIAVKTKSKRKKYKRYIEIEEETDEGRKGSEKEFQEKRDAAKSGYFELFERHNGEIPKDIVEQFREDKIQDIPKFSKFRSQITSECIRGDYEDRGDLEILNVFFGNSRLAKNARIVLDFVQKIDPEKVKKWINILQADEERKKRQRGQTAQKDIASMNLGQIIFAYPYSLDENIKTLRYFFNKALTEAEQGKGLGLSEIELKEAKKAAFEIYDFAIKKFPMNDEEIEDHMANYAEYYSDDILKLKLENGKSLDIQEVWRADFVKTKSEAKETIINLEKLRNQEFVSLQDIGLKKDVYEDTRDFKKAANRALDLSRRIKILETRADPSKKDELIRYNEEEFAKIQEKKNKLGEMYFIHGKMSFDDFKKELENIEFEEEIFTPLSVLPDEVLNFKKLEVKYFSGEIGRETYKDEFRKAIKRERADDLFFGAILTQKEIKSLLEAIEKEQKEREILLFSFSRREKKAKRAVLDDGKDDKKKRPNRKAVKAERLKEDIMEKEQEFANRNSVYKKLLLGRAKLLKELQKEEEK